VAPSLIDPRDLRFPIPILTTLGVLILAGLAASALSGGVPLFYRSEFQAAWPLASTEGARGPLQLAGALFVYAAYFTLVLTLVGVSLRRRSPMPHVAWLFLAFVAACGLEHLLSRLVGWQPLYLYAGVSKVLATALSYAAAVTVFPAAPRFLRPLVLPITEREISGRREDARREAIDHRINDAIDYLGKHGWRIMDRLAIVIVIDRDNVITHVNDRFCEVTGYAREDVVGRRHNLLYCEAHSPEFYESRLSAAAPDDAAREEVCYHTSAGDPLWVMSTIAPLRTDSSDRDERIEICTDITRQRRIRHELECKNDELEHFAETVSHGLQAPLVTIRGYLQKLMADLEVGEEHEVGTYTRRMTIALEQMKHNIEGLMEVSRAGAVERSASRQSIRSAVNAALNENEIEIERIGVRIILDLRAAHCWCSKPHLDQIVSNLFQNALRHGTTNSEPEITIRTREGSAGTVRIEVQDNGRGVDPSQRERIFQLFERGPTSAPGFGLGLAIIDRIARSYAGEVQVENAPGAGAIFHVTLPAPPVAIR
jgi:PAS domain S-box-containing protein